MTRGVRPCGAAGTRFASRWCGWAHAECADSLQTCETLAHGKSDPTVTSFPPVAAVRLGRRVTAVGALVLFAYRQLKHDPDYACVGSFLLAKRE